MRWATKSAVFFLIALPSFVWLSTAAPAAGRDEFVFDPPIAGPAISESGAWRTRTQQMFDPVEREQMRSRARLCFAGRFELARAAESLIRVITEESDSTPLTAQQFAGVPG